MRPSKLVQRAPGAGFTVLEMMIVGVILMLVVATFGRAAVSMQRAKEVVEVRTRLQEEGLRALSTILGDLRRSGFVATNGVNYPAFPIDGVPPAAFAVHAHPAPTEGAAPGDPDFGANREIIFALPGDADADGRPDIDANGDLDWDERDFSYVLVTDVDGVSRLERRIDAAQGRRIADHVERVVFDDSASTGFQLPFDSVRVRLWLRMRGDDGTEYRHFIEGFVRLRNGLQAQIVLNPGP